MQLIGHRGYPARYPENTIESFIHALKAGCVGIELDVRLTQCGELVVIHDATLDRTTNITGNVSDYNANELAEHNVPTLWNVLATLKDSDILVFIEAKEPTIGTSIANVIEDAQKQLGYDVQQLIVISFAKKVLADVQKHNAYIPLGVSLCSPELGYKADSYGFKNKQDMASIKQAIATYKPLYLVPNIHEVTAEMAALAKQHAIEIAAWTIHNAKDAAFAQQLPINYAITNDPMLHS